MCGRREKKRYFMKIWNRVHHPEAESEGNYLWRGDENLK